MAITHRKGADKDFDPQKMLPGEIAITTDGTRKVYAAFAAGDVKELSSKEDVDQAITEGLEAIEEAGNKAIENIGTGTDSSLTEEGKAADAKATGEKIDRVKTDVINYINQKAFSMKIVDTLPEVGESRTYYLVPNKSNTGYDKYWWITDDAGISKWDIFGSSTTLVVTELPEVGDEDTDYILNSRAGCLYYKYIDGAWKMIAGSMARTLDVLPSIDEGNEFTDYYIKSGDTEVYLHYRFSGGKYCQIGSDSYSKDEMDAKLSEINKTMNSLNSSINKNNGELELVKAKLEELGNLVSDVTESESGINVHYKDGTSKKLETKDTAVKVEDINKSISGIEITYTDGTSKEIEISGSGGGGTVTSGAASITRITDSSVTCVYGDECPIAFSFKATDSSGDLVGDGTATWYVGNVKKVTSVVYQGENAFDIGKYLTVGTNNIKLSISVDTGGESPIVTTKTWTVNAVNMYAQWDYDDTTVNESDTVVIRWTPYGDLAKTTHILVDGVEVATSETTRSGVMQYVTINKYPHGSHMVELYLTATVNNTEIRSDSVFHDMIFAESGNATPVISCSISETEMTQYNTMRIPVVIYRPGKLTADAVLAVDGVDVAEWTDVDRTIHYWNYTPSEYGQKVLTITCGETVKTITLTVNKLDIDNEEISGYTFRLKASDIATNDALRAWNSNGVGIAFSDNFDWKNGGIKTENDENGNVRQYICVKAGTTATIDYNLFGNDPRITGKNFKVIFKVMNCRDYDATFLSCMSGTIGIQLGANGGVVKSEQNTLNIQYAEKSYIEFEFDIRPDSTFRYIQTYLDGVLASTNIYASDDNFTQMDKQKIVIGSSDCDVYIYMVKVYESYLTANNHIENFIADAPNAQEMVLRYDRNDILAENGEISYEKLAAKNPKVREHLWDIPRMTEGKKDYVDGCSYQQIYKAGDARHQLTAVNVRICIQGTSSVNYKDSAANTDGKFTEGFTDGNGNHIDGYSMEDDSIPVNYFNTKVNVASCENINNRCLAEWYNRFQPYKTAYRLKNPKARDCMEHHMGVQFIKDQSHTLFDDDNYHMYAICNMGNSKKNSIVFHDPENPLECCIETLDNNSTHCLMNDPTFDVDDLDSEDFFEFRYPDNPTSEMKQAFVEFVKWMANSNPNAATGEELPSPVSYEPYTFRGTGQEGEVLAGTTISDYAGTYTHDTYEYRMAKMLSECEDHLIMDSIVYHGVFVDQHTMADSVCKNIFWGTEDLVHWHLCKAYDKDTADGNNNTGKLTIPFGCECMDTLGDGDVFNGKTNVWWVFIDGLYEARRTMWINREAAGAWDAEAYLAFAKEQQNIIPERVWNQDYWYKYLRLYETRGITTYIPMLEGGKKTHQREGFVTNNYYYKAGQYMGIGCTSKSITLRGYTPSTWAGVKPESKVTVMLYNKGYIVVQIGNVLKRVKAEKGKFYTIVFSDSGDMNDTVINIHGANLVRALGDLSCLYPGRCDFAAAELLHSVQIGSMEDGYQNNNLTEVGFGTNRMLGYLYIQNCPNAKHTLDLSGCQSLTELDVRGSGFTGISFAVGGLIRNALLCSPASLNMRSLYYLKDDGLSLESYDNLSTIRMEDCPSINSLALVRKTANLLRVRILDINWVLAETDLLNQMLELMGLDESDHNLEVSVLTGKVYVSGQIRNHEIERYVQAWENLIVTYDSQNLVEQYLATYVNKNGEVLYTKYVDRGSLPPDPVTEGWIDTPTTESTAQHNFTYTGWDDVTSVMLADRTITAQYTETIREYTVTWYDRPGVFNSSKTVPYGSEAVYDGDIPTNTSEEDTYVYNLFKQWDKSTGYVTSDMDVYAVWSRANLPAVGTDLKYMSIAEIFGVCTARKSADYFVDKDYFDFTMGQDLTFSNVRSELLLENTFFDGETHIDTDIRLFDADSPSFTLAIDYEFLSSCTESGSLVSAFSLEGNEGFRLRYNSKPSIQWGDKNVDVGYPGNRNMVVLRHIKESNSMYIYGIDTENNTYALVLGTSELIRTRDTETNQTLTFGALKMTDTVYDYFAIGWIHWCKIWYDDLGETVSQKLAAWVHEVQRMEFTGPNRYLLSDGSKKANGSFLCNHLLTKSRRMDPSNNNIGGWDAAELREEFLPKRVYNGFPYELQAAIKKVNIPASEGNKSSIIVVSKDYLYLPSYAELGGSTGTPYGDEGYAISFFTSNNKRIKFRGHIIKEDAQYFSNSTDPTGDSTNMVKEGDIWVKSSTETYLYLSADTASKHSITSVKASDGGFWVPSTECYTRSPHIGSTGGFVSVTFNGSFKGASIYSAAAAGILYGFSI